MQRRRPEITAWLTALGQLHVRGTAVDWTPLYRDAVPRRVDLPTHAFQERNYWLRAPSLIVGRGTFADTTDFVEQEDEPAAPDPEFRRLLAEATAQDGENLVLRMILGDAAQVLGHDSAEEMDPALGFLELGFSSFTALELNSRIIARTGFEIPAAAVFDHATPLALARYLRAELTQSELTGPEPTRQPTNHQ